MHWARGAAAANHSSSVPLPYLCLLSVFSASRHLFEEMTDHCDVRCVPVGRNLFSDIVLTQLVIPLSEFFQNSGVALPIYFEGRAPLCCEPTIIQVEDTDGFLGAMSFGLTGASANSDFTRRVEIEESVRVVNIGLD